MTITVNVENFLAIAAIRNDIGPAGKAEHGKYSTNH